MYEMFNNTIKPKILVIDADEASQALLRDQFEEKNYEVICAHDGEYGILLIEEQNPDVVVTTIDLPVMSGFAVLSYCSVIYEDLPVIVMSDIDSFSKSDATEMGAFDCFQKPISKFDEILERVDNLFKKRKTALMLSQECFESFFLEL